MRILLLFLYLLPLQLICQELYEYKVIDAHTKLPIVDASVTFFPSNEMGGTNSLGYLYKNNDPAEKVFSILGNKLSIKVEGKADIKLYSTDGKLMWNASILCNGYYKEAQLPFLNNGIYLVNLVYEKKNITYKFYFPASQTFFQNIIDIQDTLVEISKQNYLSTNHLLSDDKIIPLIPNNIDPLTHLFYLPNRIAFDKLKSKPFNQVLSGIESIKILYNLEEKEVVYFNTFLYYTHYEFASKILEYKKSKGDFNWIEYHHNPERNYIAATINYYKASNKYVLEFSSFNQVSCEQVKEIIEEIKNTAFFKDISLLVSNDYLKDCVENVVLPTELYQEQNYQPLTLNENFGYLKKIPLDSFEKTYVSWKDIPVVDGIPNDMNVVAGLITTEFQTPLSHVNVLSHNRKTPNMGLKNAYTDPKITSFFGKLVYLKVGLDTFEIREANLEEAQTFWNNKLPKTEIILNLDTITKGLINLDERGAKDVNLIGGKASNFAELKKIKLTDTTYVPLPEHSFAIPFYYYQQHMRENQLDIYINKMLLDTNFHKDPKVKESYLTTLRDKIKKAPFNPELFDMVKNQIIKSDPISTYRFRSSTNAEDIEGFNGAGLYDSHSGHLTEEDKEIDKAIKKTWASLWNLRAFDERDFFRINQQSIAMAILVHRSFPDEYANGVVVTHNPFNQINQGILINVQAGETSIVRPEENYLPDQILYYNYSIKQEAYEYLSHTTLPGFENKTIMTPAELKELKVVCQAIQNHFCEINPPCKVLDLEFKLDIIENKKKLYIKQVRYY